MRGYQVLGAPGVPAGPADGDGELRRWDPTPELEPLVAWYWVAQWDRRGLAPHRQSTLPHPSAHVVVEDDVACLVGPVSRRFERTLAGRGRVVAARFRPGAVRPLLGRAVSSITDRRLPARALAGLDDVRLAEVVEAHADADAAVAALERELRRIAPATVDGSAVLAEEAVALVAEDRSVTKVNELAERLCVSVRSVHRLFAEYVGLGPAAVIRRYRLQEAAHRAARGGDVDWAAVAAELGYCDQAHLVRDFTRQIGMPPRRYAMAAVGA